MAYLAIYGVVGKLSNVEKIIHSLTNQGIDPENISFLSTQQREDFFAFDQKKSFSEEDLRNWRTEIRVAEDGFDDFSKKEEHHEIYTKAPEGSTLGVATGGFLGGALGLLAGLGVLAIPGIGPLIVGGPLMAFLSGISAGGTIGGLIGALVGSGIPEGEAYHYEHQVKEGGMLLVIRADSEELAYRAKEILLSNGAQHVSISTESSKTHHVL